jgi:hypothetical protein
MLSFPNTGVVPLTRWSNFHHTIVDRAVPQYLTPGLESAQGPALSVALNAILKHCVETQTRLCTIGSRWSLSNILDPGDVIMDPGAWNQIAAIEPTWLTAGYRKRAARSGKVPVIVQGGTQIRTLNQSLGNAGLSLQVSGASDGHRMAGCIATGTHGSHLKVGAVHDTVLGVYLVTGPGRAVLLQPSARHFGPELAKWFSDSSALHTSDLADDGLFAAAQVALGGLGFVHSVIVEAVPLYQWRGVNVARSLTDPAIWGALETLDTHALHPLGDPDYFSLIFSPFAGKSSHGCTATLLWKSPPVEPYSSAQPVQPTTSSDTSRLLSRLIPCIDGGLVGEALSAVIAAQTRDEYPAGPIMPVFASAFFGPTTLPEGNGRSSEVVVNHAHARPAVEAVLRALQREAAAGRHLLGGVGVRFAPATRSQLGMNIHAMNTYIEIPSLGSAATSLIQRAVWRELKEAKINFVCHWGQEYGMDQASVRAYYGERVERWKRARSQLLDSPALRAVFTNPLLSRLGLA